MVLQSAENQREYFFNAQVCCGSGYFRPIATVCHVFNINTLIFDLGGVIVDLDLERTLKEFVNLSGLPEKDVVDIYVRHPAFQAYETGKIGEETFRDAIREMFNVHSTDAEINRCWNAMLLGIPDRKLDMLTRLKKHFTTIALSNTNSIHLSYLNEVILKGQRLGDYFHHAHYSHELGLRKPDPAIYEVVLQKHQLSPEKAFFLDDNADNIAAAKGVGMQAVLIRHPDEVIELFRNYA